MCVCNFSFVSPQALCTRSFKTQTIVFIRHKWRCHRLRLVFGLAGLRAAELHGNLRQQQRLEALQQFKARVCGISHPISQTRKLLPTCCRGMTTKPLRSS